MWKAFIEFGNIAVSDPHNSSHLDRLMKIYPKMDIYLFIYLFIFCYMMNVYMDTTPMSNYIKLDTLNNNTKLIQKTLRPHCPPSLSATLYLYIVRAQHFFVGDMLFYGLPI